MKLYHIKDNDRNNPLNINFWTNNLDILKTISGNIEMINIEPLNIFEERFNLETLNENELVHTGAINLNNFKGGVFYVSENYLKSHKNSIKNL